jgi:RND family efflux transporter MFP subunit
MISRRSRFAPFAIALAALAALTGCARHAADDAARAAPRPVHVAAVLTEPVGDLVRAVGLLTPKDETRLAFKTGGVIEAIRVEEGAHVRAGQLLALVKQAEISAGVDQAQQAADKAARDLARARALFADGVATEEQVQDLTTATSVAAAALRAARFNADYARIVAPADGVVLRKLAEANELVQAGQPVLVLGGATRGWIVRVGLADRDAVRVHLGDAAGVHFDAFPGQAFAGHISNIASSADPATGTFTIEIQVEPGTAQFAQGLVAKVSLQPGAGSLGRVVPVSALIEANGGEAGVFVLDSARHVVHRVAIRIGRVADGTVEVLGGLADGAIVVVDGAAFLENGEVVRVAADDAGTPGKSG